MFELYTVKFHKQIRKYESELLFPNACKRCRLWVYDEYAISGNRKGVRIVYIVVYIISAGRPLSTRHSQPTLMNSVFRSVNAAGTGSIDF